MRFDIETEGEWWQTSYYAVGFEDKENGIIKKYRNAIEEAEIGKETDFSLELSEGSRPCQYLILT